jgi:hypothetical protein
MIAGPRPEGDMGRRNGRVEAIEFVPKVVLVHISARFSLAVSKQRIPFGRENDARPVA